MEQVVEWNTIESNHWSGIHGSTLSNSAVTIAHNTIKHNDKEGIYLLGYSVDLSVHDNDIETNGSTGLRLTASSPGTPFTASIVNNTISGNTYDGIYSGSGSVNLVVQGNQAEDNTYFGIVVYQEANATIGGTSNGAANVFSNNDRAGIYLNNVHGALKWNTIESNHWSGIHGSTLSDSTVTIAHNTIKHR